MLEHAQKISYLMKTALSLTLIIAVIYATVTIFQNDGEWVVKVVSGILSKQAQQKKQKSESIGKMLIDRLLEKDGKLAVKLLQKVMEKRVKTPPSKKPPLLEKTIDQLLANDGELLATILAKMNEKRKNPMEEAIRRLLAQDGRLLTKILIRMSRANSRRKSNNGLSTLLLKHPKVVSQILSDVLKSIGVKEIMRTTKNKVRAINTRLSLQYEIRRALTKLPFILAKMQDIQQKKKTQKNVSWRKIKAQFPRIRNAFRQNQCLRLIMLRRIKGNRIRAVVRVKLLQASCRKRSCEQHVQDVDNIILRATKQLGVQRGQIQIRFGFIRRKCNTDR